MRDEVTVAELLKDFEDWGGCFGQVGWQEACEQVAEFWGNRCIYITEADIAWLKTGGLLITDNGEYTTVVRYRMVKE